MNAVLAAIAEPRRADILRLVWRDEQAAGQIAEAMPITFGAVSQHLKVLLEAGAVTVRVAVRQRFYIANHDALGPMALALQEIWFGTLGELKRLAEAEQARMDAQPPNGGMRRAHAHGAKHRGKGRQR